MNDVNKINAFIVEANIIKRLWIKRKNGELPVKKICVKLKRKSTFLRCLRFNLESHVLITDKLLGLDIYNFDIDSVTRR